MNKRIKKKKSTMTAWNGVVISLSSPAWKRRKARSKMGRHFRFAAIGSPNKNRRTYSISTLAESMKVVYDGTIKLTPVDNTDNVLFEGEVEHPCDSSYLNGTFGCQKTTP